MKEVNALCRLQYNVKLKLALLLRMCTMLLRFKSGIGMIFEFLLQKNLYEESHFKYIAAVGDRR